MLDSLDHIVIAVGDLEAARQTAIALLGRTPSWSGSHPGLGTRNVLFRLPILERCRTEDEVRHEVMVTVVHEVAHHFGIDDARLRELGWG